MLPHLIFEAEIIRDHRNKLAIRGLSSIILNGISKITVQRIHVAPIPRDLDGVADGSFDSRRCGLVFLGNGGVEDFGDAVYDVAIRCIRMEY